MEKKSTKDDVDGLDLGKKDWEDIKKGFMHRWLKKNGYKINPWLIMAGFLIPVALILYNGFASGWVDKYTVSCPTDGLGPCRNPFNSCDPLTTSWCPDAKLKAVVCGSNPGFCLLPTLKPGERYGYEKTFIEKNFTWLLLISLSTVYLINHNLYNSKSQREERKNAYLKE